MQVQLIDNSNYWIQKYFIECSQQFGKKIEDLKNEIEQMEKQLADAKAVERLAKVKNTRLISSGLVIVQAPDSSMS